MSEVEKLVLEVGEIRKVGRWEVERVAGVLFATVDRLAPSEDIAIKSLSTITPGRLLTNEEHVLAAEIKPTGISPCSGFLVTRDPASFSVTIQQVWNHTQMMCWELSEWAQTSASKKHRNASDASRKKSIWRGHARRRLPGLRRNHHQKPRKKKSFEESVREFNRRVFL